VESAAFLIQSQEMDIHQRDLAGKTALSYAAFGGHSQIVDFLIKLGAEVDAMVFAGRTPLFSAATGEALGNLIGKEKERTIQG
jgi:ankyrin repeat protein